MKRILLIMVFCCSIAFPAAFAGDDSIDAHIESSLYLYFHIPYTKCLANTNDYQQSSFVYSGIQITAFKSKTTNWAGFYKKLSADDLPGNAITYIKEKYNNSTIEKVTMYFNREGDVSYFAVINTGHKNIVLQIKPSGETKVFGCKTQLTPINSKS